MVNWSAAVECKRCGSLLTVQQKAAEAYVSDPIESKAFFSGGMIILAALLGVAMVALILSRVFHLIQGETADICAVIFIFGGALLAVLAHLWLVVRVFEQSIAWGLASLFIPFVGIVAIIKFWDKTRRSFIAQLVCLAIAYVGVHIAH